MPVLSAMDVTGAERKPRARPGAAVHERARPPAKPEVRARRLADAAAEPRATGLRVFSANGHGGRFARVKSRAAAVCTAKSPSSG